MFNPTTKKIKLTDDDFIFDVKNIHFSYINAIRRLTISHVETICIDIITIETNTTFLYDEFICHKIGLIPIICLNGFQLNHQFECECQQKENKKKYENFPKCCEKCSVTFNLDKKCIGDKMTITSDDLISSNENVMTVSNYYKKIKESKMKDIDYEEELFSVYDPIVITNLGKNQELKLSATSVKGIGWEHAKWSPVSSSYFYYEPEIIINKKINKYEKEKKVLIESCPRKILILNENKEVEINDHMKCNYCGHCKSILKNFFPQEPNFISIEPKKEKEGFSFRYFIESNGSLTAKDIVLKAIDVCLKKLKTIEESI